MKIFFRATLVLYLLMLLWLVLFKFSTDFASVLLNYQSRSLNLVPFAGASHGGLHEMADNVAAFIPLGLLLSVNLKRMSFWWKLICAFLISLTVEVLQFVLAIGVTDITDVIMNTFGGFLGLAFYGLINRYIASARLDRLTVAVNAVLLIAFLMLRFLIFKVKY